MEDRELLMMAAKAAGIKIIRRGKSCGAFIDDGSCWSPLTDDGDALRLMVMLGLEIDLHPKESGNVSASPFDEAWISEVVSCEQDIFSAARRVIVRAAAEIGKSLP